MSPPTQTQLAALDHSANNSRDHATASTKQNKESFISTWSPPKEVRSGLLNQLWRRRRGTMYAHCWMQLSKGSVKMLLKEVPLSQHHIFHATFLAPLDQIKQSYCKAHIDFLILE